LLSYTPHGTSYRVFNTFDETAPYPHDVSKCAGDMEMEEIIFVDEEL
jgi:hypothetical protein